MFKTAVLLSSVLLLSVFASGVANAGPRDGALAVVMTNDLKANAIKVYDAETRRLLQTLPTNGKGGAGGNANGVKQYQGELVAAVNYGSNSVAIYQREGGRLRFETLVYTTSQPVSIDFGNAHMYVAGTTSVDSFSLRHHHVDRLDGSAQLALADGGAPPAGSTAQVGVLDDRQLLVTLKADPAPGTVDTLRLSPDGAITEAIPTAVSAPDGTLTPFGFAVYPDGSAVITLAHSSQNGLFRDGHFTEVIAAGQTAPCWMTRVGKYVFVANTASGTLSRLIGTGRHVFVDRAVAATIATGNPTDLDGRDGVLVAIDHGSQTSHLSLFTYNAFGELAASGLPIDLGVVNANGVALMPSLDRDDR